MIENNIIQSLGAGSGIDTRNLVTQLTAVEGAAPQQRIDSTTQTTQTQISDFGLLKSALSTLQASAQNLVAPESLFSKTAAFTESDALVPASLSTDVKAGVYNFTVEDVAQSQAIAFEGLSADDAPIGEGTLSFNLGNWTRDVDGRATSFTANPEAESFDVVIDDTNNTLEGLRDAINDADQGIQASIIFDGDGFRLSVLAASGSDNELQITADEGGLPADNTDASGLSRFAFNASQDDFTTQATETQSGNNAELTINGLPVSRSSNTIDDVVEGLTLDILKADPGQKVTVTVADDKDFAKQSIRDFVDTYNAFLEATDPIFGVKEEVNDDGDTETVIGSLAGDSLAKSILTRIRATITNTIPGLADNGFTSLARAGIQTERDGTISIDNEEFDTAFDERFEDVQKLFAPNTSTTDPAVFINSFNDRTATGEYDVNVTSQPSRGGLEGTAIAGGFPNFDTTGQDHTFKIRVNGNESDTITLPSADYADQDAVALALQAAINSDTNLKENGSSVLVNFDQDNNRFTFTSNQYGTNSGVNITEASADLLSDFGLDVANGSQGSSASGTIDGKASFGSGNVLLPELGDPAQGLALVIGDNATSATVNFSRGFAGEIDGLIAEFLDSDGVIAARETSLEDTLDRLDTDQDNLDRKLSAFEERLMNQFISMERIINSINSSSSFLDNLFDTLPFTARDG